MKFSSTELINFLFSEKASFMLDAHIVKLLALALNYCIYPAVPPTTKLSDAPNIVNLTPVRSSALL